MKYHPVIIGWIHRDEVHPLFQTSVERLRDSVPGNVRTIAIHSSPKLDFARNRLFHEWLSVPDSTHLLMVDTDMEFPEDSIKRLRGYNKDLVGGIYFTGGWDGPVRPAVSKFEMVDDKPVIVDYWNYPPNTLIEVGSLGGGFMMIRRKLAEDMYKAMGAHPLAWFAFGQHNGVEIGEDVAFCLRAQKIGYQPFCDTGLEANHMKSMKVNSASYVASLLDERHPRYTQRQDVPVFRETVGGNSSLNGYGSSDQGVPQERESRFVDVGPDTL